MRTHDNTHATNQRQYLTIESVVLSFGDELLAERKNTLVLRRPDAVEDFLAPFRVTPVLVGDQDETMLVLPCVWLEAWDGVGKPLEQALAELNAAASSHATLDLDGISFVTYLEHRDEIEPLHGLGPINALQVLEKLNELDWMRCSGFRPKWYSDQLHGEAFDAQAVDFLATDSFEIMESFFTGKPFHRRLKADLLLQRLDRIPASALGADAFHDWVLEALDLLFVDDLVRLQKHPNGNATERRDIVATNIHRNQFWRRIYEEYKVSMPVFEVKNYDKPHVDDFRQVHSYLDYPHHGDLGFLILRKQDFALDATTFEHFQRFYQKHGLSKLIIVLPSAKLAELLTDFIWGRREHVDDKMSQLLEDFLLKYMYK
jgi:hypothetical protein